MWVSKTNTGTVPTPVSDTRQVVGKGVGHRSRSTPSQRRGPHSRGLFSFSLGSPEATRKFSPFFLLLAIHVHNGSFQVLLRFELLFHLLFSFGLDFLCLLFFFRSKNEGKFDSLFVSRYIFLPLFLRGSSQNVQRDEAKRVGGGGCVADSSTSTSFHFKLFLQAGAQSSSYLIYLNLVNPT